MASPRSAWGIDIGNRALKAIKLVRDGNGVLSVGDFEVIEHETLLSNAGDNRDSLIQSALANFVQRHPVRGDHAGVSVSGSTSLARFIPLPPVEPRKIPEIVRFEAIQQIPFPLDEVEWSYQLFQKPDSPEVEVGIFAMKKELVNGYMQFFTDVGLDVEVVQLNPLAVYNAMYHDDRLRATTMIIDLGSENTDLIIADGETIWLRSIPVGGKAFTEILAKQFKLSFAKAEELKRTAATSKYAKQIFQAMRPVFADLVVEVQRSIGFYASVHRESKIKRVLALGGTFRLPGLQKYLQQNLQLDVARIDNLAAGGPSDAKSRATFDENVLSMASAYGLAIQAMGSAKITSSLLPQHIRREKTWRDKTPWFAAAAACFVVGTGIAMGSYFLQNTQYDQAVASRAKTADTLRSAHTLDTNWKTQVEQTGAGDRQRIANVQSLAHYRQIWPDLLRDVYSALPTPSKPELISNNWDEIRKTPRKQRDVLLVDSITSAYASDLTKVVASAAPAASDPNNPQPAAAPSGGLLLPGLSPTLIAPGTRGFVMTIDMVTPYAGERVEALRFIDRTFIPAMNALKTKEAADNKEFSVVYAAVTSIQKVADNGAFASKIRVRQDAWNRMLTAFAPPTSGDTPASPAPTGPTGFGVPLGSRPPGTGFGQPLPPGGTQPGGLQPGMLPNGTLDPNALIDPNTGEDMASDTFIEVTALVTLIDDDAPKTPAAAPTAPAAAPSASAAD